MAKFRFYITDTFDGTIVGTNSESEARDHAASTDYFVVDAQEGVWFGEDGDSEVKGINED